MKRVEAPSAAASGVAAADGDTDGVDPGREGGPSAAKRSRLGSRGGATAGGASSGATGGPNAALPSDQEAGSLGSSSSATRTSGIGTVLPPFLPAGAGLLGLSAGGSSSAAPSLGSATLGGLGLGHLNALLLQQQQHQQLQQFQQFQQQQVLLQQQQQQHHQQSLVQQHQQQHQLQQLQKQEQQPQQQQQANLLAQVSQSQQPQQQQLQQHAPQQQNQQQQNQQQNQHLQNMQQQEQSLAAQLRLGAAALHQPPDPNSILLANLLAQRVPPALDPHLFALSRAGLLAQPPTHQSGLAVAFAALNQQPLAAPPLLPHSQGIDATASLRAALLRGTGGGLGGGPLSSYTLPLHSGGSAAAGAAVAAFPQHIFDASVSGQGGSGSGAAVTASGGGGGGGDILASTSGSQSRRIVPVALPSDQETLSEYQCLLREQIIYFEANVDDIEATAQGRNKPIVLRQVGILCRHCARLAPGYRPRGAVYFPARLSGIYQAAQNQAINHFADACRSIPDATRSRLLHLKEKKTFVLGGGKQYWANAAEVAGVTESDDGLSFRGGSSDGGGIGGGGASASAANADAPSSADAPINR